MNQKDFTVKEFGIVSQSKKEVYYVLKIEGGYYLPPIEQANADYISDILSGDKMVVMCKNVINRRIPKIQGLRVRDMIEFANNIIDLEKYLPSLSDNIQHDRQWIINLINSLIPDEFNDFVFKALHERENKYVSKKSIKMNIKPEFVSLFRDSSFISKSTGKFYHNVKSSQDRRKQNIQSESLKREAEQKKRANDIRDERLQQLEGQLEEFNKLKGECNEYKDKLSALYNEGIIDLEGEIVNRGRHNREHEEESKSENSDM